MRKMIALLKREWLEHRAGFVLGPLIVLGIVLFSSMIAIVANDNVEWQMDATEQEILEERLAGGGERIGALNMAAAMAFDIAAATDAELQAKFDVILNTISVPFHWVLFAVTFFALVGCIYNERKDHSVLFWKSMPATSAETVGSKYVFIVWLAPLVTVAAVFVAQLLVVIMSAAFVEDGMGGRVWAASGLWLRPLELLFGYVVYGLWVMPVFAWLVFVSSFSGSPYLVGLGAPVGVMFLEVSIVGTAHVGEFIGRHITPVTLPSGDPSNYVGPFSLLGAVEFWLGIALGIGLLAGAVYYRGRNNEI